ncbi:MAG TPA: sugar kinase [Spirochaetia bacterium]|nr:sugar kinase [Spirochaetia bacterium]
MAKLEIKEKNKCLWDEISLGEVMLRLDPGEGRIRTAREFKVWEGGGEYNVARGLKKCFGLSTAVVTAVVENDLGFLLCDLMQQGGVDLRYIRRLPFDGIGREARIGLNFTERGYGIRAALGVSDRGHSAASKIKPEDIDWEQIFGKDQVRWFHTGGIYAALSPEAAQTAITAMKCAKKHGTTISYDLNFRASLWKANGGQKKAVEINREIASYVDVMIGNEEDFSAALGFEISGSDEGFSNIEIDNYKKMIEKTVKSFPNFRAIATTLRTAKTATINDWGALLFYDNNFYEATLRENLEIFDRVGGGDSFASGLIYGFLSGKSPKECVEYGAAHGALAMTTPGDTSTAILSEVEKVIKSKSARVER